MLHFIENFIFNKQHIVFISRLIKSLEYKYKCLNICKLFYGKCNNITLYVVINRENIIYSKIYSLLHCKKIKAKLFLIISIRNMNKSLVRKETPYYLYMCPYIVLISVM